MRKTLIILVSLVILTGTMDWAEAYDTINKVNVANNDGSRTVIMVVTRDDQPDKQIIVGAPSAHTGSVETRDAAWYAKKKSYSYGMLLHWEGETTPYCNAAFTVQNEFVLVAPKVLSCKATGGTCRVEARVYNNQCYVTVWPHTR